MRSTVAKDVVAAAAALAPQIRAAWHELESVGRWPAGLAQALLGLRPSGLGWYGAGPIFGR